MKRSKPATVAEQVKGMTDDQLWGAVKKAHKEHVEAKTVREKAERAFAQAQADERRANSQRLQAQKRLNMRLKGEA